MTYPTSKEEDQLSFPSKKEHYVPSTPASAPGVFSGQKGLYVGLAFGVVLTFVGGQVLSRISQSQTADSGTEVVSNVQNGATQTVTVASVKSSALSQKLTATGTVQAIDLLRVTPQVSGLQIKEVRVREGARVTTGQILAVLDDSELQSQILQAEANRAQAEAQVVQQEALKAQAEATLAEAKESWQRYQSLFDQGAISEEQLTSRRTQVVTNQESVRVAIANIQSAQATVTSRDAEISRLQTQLNQTLVRSPANGIISERTATIGDTSSTSTTLYQLIREDLLELEVQLPQSQLAEVVTGAPVQIASATDSQIQLEGSVRSIEPVVDAQTRQATLKISLPANNRLRVGMFLQANIITGTNQGLTVPVEALLPQPDNTFQVFTLAENNTAKAQTVEVGPRLPATANQSAQIAILSGLANGEQVIVEGASYLSDGDQVTIAEGFLQ